MHVKCKNCGKKIPVAGRPTGGAGIRGADVSGNVRIEGGTIAIGPGGIIRIGPGGAVVLGPPPKSEFACPNCLSVREYAVDDILDD